MAENPTADSTRIEAVILAGGFGTRLNRHVPDTPKVLAPVGERPFLALQLDWLAAQGITKATLAIHHLAEQVIAYAEETNGAPIPLSIVREGTPLGTGGAVANAFRQQKPRGAVLVINGDTHFRFALAPILAAHRAWQSRVTVVAAQVADAARFGTVQVNDEHAVTSFIQAAGRHEPGLVNVGAYILEPAAMADAPGGVFSIEHDFFPGLAAAGNLRAFVLDAAEAFFDIGTPESYDAFNRRHTRV